MRVDNIPCGPAANESERKAFLHLKQQLLSIAGHDQWILLTNLAFSVTHQHQSDEIDIIAIGPPGIRVIEVKHWDAPVGCRKTAPSSRLKPTKLQTKRAKSQQRCAKSSRVSAGSAHRSCSQKAPPRPKASPANPFSASAFTHSPTGKPPSTLTPRPYFLAPMCIGSPAPSIPGAQSPSTAPSGGSLATQISNSRHPKKNVSTAVYRGIHQPSQDAIILHLYDPVRGRRVQRRGPRQQRIRNHRQNSAIPLGPPHSRHLPDRARLRRRNVLLHPRRPLRAPHRDKGLRHLVGYDRSAPSRPQRPPCAR